MAIEETRGPLLKKYLFWTYERGSFHYDVMVTLILLFIFVSPRFFNFGDKPVPDVQVRGNDVLVQASGSGGFVYQVSANQIQPTSDEAALQQELIASIRPIAGPMQLDRYDAVKDPNSGKVTIYRIFAHRAADSRVQ
jgi:hypothetical protein